MGRKKYTTKYKRAGVVKRSEISIESGLVLTRSGIKLWPEEGWRYPITINRDIMLTLPDGSSYHPKVIGGEIMNPKPGYGFIVIEPIAEIENEVPEGSKVYMDNETVEIAKRYAFYCKHYYEP